MKGNTARGLMELFLYDRFKDLVNKLDKIGSLKDTEIPAEDAFKAIVIFEEMALLDRTLYGLLLQDDDEEAMNLCKDIQERQALQAEILWDLKQELTLA